ncbi:maleylpyruvate isomerase N-terminal domain-containing protein [Streptomyces sp. NPDC090442]|uniref:maleylpyruvate isomerase N-terminal domain-containing protein n=1 Tax=Streptomyces sp. NPDC090442 TaxID=3365962 RepID=UPI0037F8A9D0
MRSPAQSYRASFHRIRSVVGRLPAQRFDARVPACPEWSVRDLLAHLVGVAADHVTGRLDGAPGPLWTHRHVREHRRLAPAILMDRWQELATDLGPLLSGAEPRTTLVHDIVQHEADLLAATGGPQPLPRDAWLPLLDDLCRTAASWMAPDGVLVVRSAGRSWWIGEGARPTAVLDAPAFELWRGFFGRRSLRQMTAWPLAGSDPGLARLPRFPPRESDLAEDLPQ